MELTAVIPVCIASIIFIVILIVRHEKKRTESLEIMAPVRGFFFKAKSDMNILPSQAAGLHVFGRGHTRRIANLLQKPDRSGSDFQCTRQGRADSSGIVKKKRIHVI